MKDNTPLTPDEKARAKEVQALIDRFDGNASELARQLGIKPSGTARAAREKGYVWTWQHIRDAVVKLGGKYEVKITFPGDSEEK